MAGPGGGPPRKSHTKSRKGCKTCKRRHIRCDETFPQCRNCTKHSCRCDYMDSPPPPDEPGMPKEFTRPSGLWTPSIEAEVENWMRSGIFPFPELGLHNHALFGGLTKFDYRLVYHLAAIHKDLQRKGCLYLTPWVGKLPDFFEVANGFPFVMSAILAFSAQHLATEMNSSEISSIGFQHRGVALQGLTETLGALAPQNSDPILAASILLLWQESDWNGWTSLMAGTALVLSSVAEWKLQLRFATFVEDHVQAREPKPLFVSQTLGGVMAPMLPEDDQSLEEALTSMTTLLPFLHGNLGLRQFAEEHVHLARDFHMCTTTMRLEQLFEQLQNVRQRLLWAPIRLVQSVDPTKMNLLVVAHLYSLAMAIDASLPELQGAAFGALVTAPMDQVDRNLQFGPTPNGFERTTLDSLMSFPRTIADKTRAARFNFDPLAGVGGNDDALSTGQQSPYGLQNLGINSGPTTPNFPPSYPSFPSNLSNISAEDLSVPPSPFLSSWATPPGQHPAHMRRHSGLPEASHGHSPRPSSTTFERPNSIAFDRQSFSGFSNHGFGGDSPQYSHGAPSPVPSQYLDQDDGSQHNSFLGDIPSLGEIPNTGPLSWPYASGFTIDESLDKNKGQAF